MRYRYACVLALVAALVPAAFAQTKAPVAPADCGRWETLVAQPRGGMSPDGNRCCPAVATVSPATSGRPKKLRFSALAEP